MTDDRASWLAWRKQGLGGSDIAAVVGLSPWTSPWALWAEKTGLVEDDDDTEAMEFGRRAEAMVAEWFRYRTELEVVGEQTWLTHPEHEWMRATADGFVVESANSSIEDALGVLEIKTTSAGPEEWAREIPAHYQCQAQWLMAVSGLDRVWLAVLHMSFGRVRFRIYEVERDEADIKYLMDAGAAFWKLVETGTPPEVDGSESTTTTLQKAWEGDRGETVELDPAVLAHLVHEREWLERKQAEVDRLTNAIKAQMQSATEGTVNGLGVCSWRPSKAVDTVRLLADLRWDDAVKTLNDAGFEVADHLRLDVSDWVKANRKRADTYKTLPGPRRFLLAKEKLT